MAVALSSEHVAIRADDHVVLGVQWWGAKPVGSGSPAHLRVDAAGGGLLLTLPPQHVGEQSLDPGVPIDLVAALLAGTSRVAVALARDTLVTLDVEGILAAIAGGRLIDPPAAAAGGTPATSIEMPYGLLWSPTSADGPVSFAHRTSPVAGPSQSVGLWHSTVFGPHGSPLRYGVPEVLRRASEPGGLPLDDAKRQAVVDATSSTGQPAVVDRLQLSSLGGSLTAAGSWDQVDWSQQIALGRDQHVRLVLGGILYPFGHRALYIEAADRVLDDADGTAALRTHRTLIVTEPSKSMVVDDPSLNRQFPFDDVEIMQLEFTGLGVPLQHQYVRPAPDASELENALAAARAVIDNEGPIVTQAEDQVLDPSQLGTPEAEEYLAKKDQLDTLGPQLNDAESAFEAGNKAADAIDALERQIDQLQSGFQGPDGPDPGVQQQIAEINLRIADLRSTLQSAPSPIALQALRDQFNTLSQRVGALFPIVEQQRRVHFSIEALAASGMQEAIDVLAAQAEVVRLTAEIAALGSLAINREWIIGPRLLPVPPMSAQAPPEALAPLLLPVRCSTRGTAQADVHMRLPLLFVVDFDLPADDTNPEFHSLVDGDAGGSLGAILEGIFTDQRPVTHTLSTGSPTPHGTHPFDDLDAVDPLHVFQPVDPVDPFELVEPVEPVAKIDPADLVAPVRFLDDDGPVAADDGVLLAGAVGRGLAVALAGVDLDVVHGAVPVDGDRLEVHSLSLVGVAHAGSFVPAITQYAAVLPAVRGLLGDAQSQLKSVVYRAEFLAHGEVEDVALAFADQPLTIDFRAQADKAGALLAPVIDATGISRLHGPVSVDALVGAAAGALDPLKLLGDGATLLGVDLRQLLGTVSKPPTIVQQVLAGRPPTIHMEWTDIVLTKVVGPFQVAPRPGVQASFTLIVDAAAEGASTMCTVRDFALCFPSPNDPLLQLSFDSVVFTQRLGQAPDLALHGVSVQFLGDLKLLEGLQEHVAIGDNVPSVKVSTAGVGVSYAFAVPDADCGEFVLRNIAVRAALDVPFQPTDDHPVTLSLGFASRPKPFNLSVMALGGGGYIDLQLDRSGLRRMELALEFGATVAVDFVIATAEVHALGGARLEVAPGGHVSITGYLRIGGSLELLGLVTVTVELVLSLRYDPPSLHGRATLVIDVDLTLYSDSIELDSGEWTLLGGGSSTTFAADEPVTFMAGDDGLAAWREYRQAFAEEVVG